MKITLLRDVNKNTKFSKGDKLYAVMGQFRSGAWGFANFTGINPFQKDFRSAEIAKTAITRLTGGYWTEDKFRVAKIEL